MKKLLKIRAFFLLFALLFALSGCTGEKAVEQSGNAYTIYYLNASRTSASVSAVSVRYSLPTSWIPDAFK